MLGVTVLHLNELYKICTYAGRHDKNVFTSRELFMNSVKEKNKRPELSESLLGLITDESEGHFIYPITPG